MSEPVRPTQREYWNSKVGEEWARQADRTDTMFAALTETAMTALALAPGERVLDIGCGAGATTLAAARQVGPGGRAVGVDISQPLLALARERSQSSRLDVSFIEADAANADVPGGPFDAAFSRFGVMFFEDAIAAFARIRRSLRSNGRLVFVCWRTFPENGWSWTPVKAIEPMLAAPLPPPDPNLPGPFFFADEGKIRSVLAGAGWREAGVERWDGPLVIGADASDAAAYLLKIGPVARAIAEHGLDVVAVEQRLIEVLAQAQTPRGVVLPAACWIVKATA
ncbi:MAG: class I SAM-dependent methyltransferase [Hyphomonadaceae bacterium]